MMTNARDAAWMNRALLLAERGRGRTTPNPLVGAIVVSGADVVVGQGAHLDAGGPHAEIHALDMAGSLARGATLYCTLEPCCHTGRTGPCAPRVVDAGIARVVVAMVDPDPRVRGEGLALLRARGLDVVDGVEEGRAARQNAPFVTWITARRPFVTLKAALSRDGFVGRPGERVRLTGAAADRFFHRQRAEIDAIAVGSTTVQDDDPRLTARGAYRARPLTRVIVDWRGRVGPEARVFSTLDAGPVIMIVHRDAAARQREAFGDLLERGVTLETFDHRSIGAMLGRLAERQILSLLVEGGPALQAAFFESGLVDRVQWVMTPRALGRGLPLAPGAGRQLRWDMPPRIARLGDDVLVEFDVHRTD
jgi:diaminohydroxyphosphoribosylaminopyrimidine deaminase/5-amino-6-(5-phosphoribosylamino)uracil reductase